MTTPPVSSGYRIKLCPGIPRRPSTRRPTGRPDPNAYHLDWAELARTVPSARGQSGQPSPADQFSQPKPNALRSRQLHDFGAGAADMDHTCQHRLSPTQQHRNSTATYMHMADSHELGTPQQPTSTPPQTQPVPPNGLKPQPGKAERRAEGGGTGEPAPIPGSNPGSQSTTRMSLSPQWDLGTQACRGTTEGDDRTATRLYLGGTQGGGAPTHGSNHGAKVRHRVSLSPQ